MDYISQEWIWLTKSGNSKTESKIEIVFGKEHPSTDIEPFNFNSFLFFFIFQLIQNSVAALVGLSNLTRTTQC